MRLWRSRYAFGSIYAYGVRYRASHSICLLRKRWWHFSGGRIVKVKFCMIQKDGCKPIYTVKYVNFYNKRRWIIKNNY